MVMRDARRRAYVAQPDNAMLPILPGSCQMANDVHKLSPGWVGWSLNGAVRITIWPMPSSVTFGMDDRS